MGAIAVVVRKVDEEYRDSVEAVLYRSDDRFGDLLHQRCKPLLTGTKAKLLKGVCTSGAILCGRVATVGRRSS